MSEFKTRTEEPDFFVITLPISVTAANTESLVNDAKPWLESPAKTYVLDFSGVTSIAPGSYRNFLQLNQTIKKISKNMVCINCSKAISDQFKTDGLHSVFVQAGTLEALRKQASAPSPKVTNSVEFIQPFVQAAQSTLKVQANMDSKAGKPHVKQEKYPYEIGIAGVISLVSDGFTGSIALCFPAPVFLKVYENLVGEAATEISPEIQDAAGELLNIIFGQAKTVLNDKKGYKINKAIPTILVGDRLKIQSQNREQSIILPFETSVGPFHIEVSLQPESSIKVAA